MQHINNLARFNQQMNYFGFPMQATDVDSVTHIKGKFYLFNEAKCEGTDVTRGQLIFFRELIEDLGSKRPLSMSLPIIAHDQRTSSLAKTSRSVQSSSKPLMLRSW